MQRFLYKGSKNERCSLTKVKSNTVKDKVGLYTVDAKKYFNILWSCLGLVYVGKQFSQVKPAVIFLQKPFLFSNFNFCKTHSENSRCMYIS